jgi:hypothetical protein
MELKDKAKQYFELYADDVVYYLPELDKFVNIKSISHFNEKKVLFKRKWVDKSDINFPDNWEYEISIIEDKYEAMEKPKIKKKVL